MSSWLGGLGSGLGQSLGQVGGSLSSFTGQISSFTKDMLLEGVEEVGDAATELQVSNSKLADAQAAFACQKLECERLKKLQAELEEKLEASEIQIKRQSAEYRTLMQQKDAEIGHLKVRQSGLHEEVLKLQRSTQSASSSPVVLPVTTASSSVTTSSLMSHHQGFHGDDMDLSDVIWSQQEINRLSAEVTRLEVEVAHWKRMSQASAAAVGAGNSEQGDIVKHQKTIKELRDEMSREMDEHQHELAALQDAQRQKMLDLSRRHREELAEYEERIEELEVQLHSGAVAPASSPSDVSKVLELQATINALREATEQRETHLSELTASLEEAQRKRALLESDKDNALEENAGLLENYARLQASIEELQMRVQDQEGKALHKVQLDHEIQVLRKNLAVAEKETERLKSLIEGNLQQRLNEHTGEGGPPAEPETLKVQKDLLDGREKSLKATEEERDTLLTELEELDRHNQEATQHIILVKEQLSGQLKEAEAEVSRLNSELSASRNQKSALELELETQKEKMSQSAFTLNDLHMCKEQLEATVRELKDQLVQVQEKSMEACRDMAELRQSLQEREEQLLATKEELSWIETGTEPGQDPDEQARKERDLSDLHKEVSDMRSFQEKLMSEDYQLQMENRKLKDEHQQAVSKADDLSMQLKESHAATSRTLREKDTRFHTLKLEKDQLEGKLQQAERSLSEQDRHHQQTIEELTRVRSMDASALQREHGMLRLALEEKDKQLSGMKEENSHLKEELDRVRDQQSRPQAPAEPRTLDIITELEAEIAQLKSSRGSMEEEVQVLRQSLEEKQVSLLESQSELEQAHARHKQTTLNYDRLVQARDEELARLQQTEDRLGESPNPVVSRSTELGDIILQEDKTQSLNQENDTEKHDLSKLDLEILVRGMKEKETEISQLNEKNLSLTRQLDQLVVSRDEVGKLSQMILQKDLEIQALHARVSMGGGGGGHGQDVFFLQQQLQAYAVEREQVLAVLNEKTRENSHLRSDYHHLMDIMAGKEAALLKLQQENQRLSNMSDPSGSQEMFKETIQNLSRIIREKDIEIDALTQKCQTLVTVLQSTGGDSGSGGVSSNQFEELLKERDTLKQQVKKMEEWKQQVITTVKNMQHESAQLQEELIKLQAQVSADGDSSAKLSVDYTRLIQSYEHKEQRLGRLSLELAQVQQALSQLSSTKDLLLARLEIVDPASEIKAAQLSVADPPSHQVTKLPEDLASLQTRLAEREGLIRTLQEHNHRLSCSASSSESEQRSHAAEVLQVRACLEALQRSVRDKDLLIKTKGDQLAQVSENLRNRENDNEVLKQAVTNLKERALILEMDVKKLKEENELVAARSREKETEFRALQETNMQVSLLLREREFELSALRDKAATVEKMLKDKEQGKSGELNQLLNEIKSMQEKAVAFQQERDQVMMALKQKQMETTALQTELQHTRDKEQRLNLELERLRNHLLEIEDSYTREALAAEDRETELRKRVALLEERLSTSSSVVESASLQASMQVESLQEQLSGVVKQREDALTQLRTSQEQVTQYAVSLSNLQMVLEQFQQEEKAMYSAELDKLRKEKEEWKKKADKLEDLVSALQMNLDEANAALDSASRLTDQLDLKEEQVEDLKKQVAVRQEMLEEAQKKLMNLLNSTEGKIDKVLMRNLFLGYFHTPKTKRVDVLRLMGSVLGLSKEDVEKMLEADATVGVSGWVSSWLGGRGAQIVPNTPQRPDSDYSFNSSFSEMFVRFLETESTPSLPAPKLPLHDIKPLRPQPFRRTYSSASATCKRAADCHPFLAPRSAAVPLLDGGPGGHLLMKPISDALPTFTPVPMSAETSGGAVLKDLLKQ